MLIKLTVFAALAAAVIVPANADTITTIYNTGVDATGVATTGNGADLHWALASGAAYNGATNGSFPIGPWMDETSAARWVTPTQDVATETDPVDHVYAFTETFSLAGYDATTAAFAGRFADDNNVDSITLNGTTLAASGGGFASWTSFDSTGGTFNAGDNLLTFMVRNSGNGNGPNPGGLLVQLTGSADTAAVPEASVWAMMIAGFGMVGFAMRRRTAVAFA